MSLGAVPISYPRRSQGDRPAVIVTTHGLT